MKATTQQLILNGVTRLWEIADHEEFQGFSPMPATAPTASLVWRDREVTDLGHIQFSVAGLLATPFVPARGRSRFEHERNLMAALLHASIPTRTAEIGGADWAGVEVWEIARGQDKPLRRWPIEAALTGEVALDDTHRIFLTVGRSVPTKSDEYRGLPVIGLAERHLLGYARAWIEQQCNSVRYLRLRSRRTLGPDLRADADKPETLRLLIGGAILSVDTLVTDSALFRKTHTLTTPGRLETPHGQIALDAKSAMALRDLLFCAAADIRYGEARRAFENGTPVRDVFWGAFLPPAWAARCRRTSRQRFSRTWAGRRKAGPRSDCGGTRRERTSTSTSTRCARSVGSSGTRVPGPPATTTRRATRG